jgi:predicted NBD/HSP70 family sugar kinase
MVFHDKASSQQMMKTINQQKVLNLIYYEGPISRVEIAAKTGLTQQTITNIVSRLLNENIVKEGTPTISGAGRKPIPLLINDSELYAIGIDVTVKYIRGVLVDFQGKVLFEAQQYAKQFESAKHVVSMITSVVESILHQANKEQIKGVGISIQGLVNNQTGTVLNAPTLKFKDFPLKEILEKQFPYPFILENDVNMLAIVENMNGCLSSSQHNITLKLDQGIGGAIVIGKQLYDGNRHAAGEFGHYKAFEGEDALPCHCGGRGCLTTVASVGSLERHLHMDLKEITHCLVSGDKKISALIDEVGESITKVLANNITILNPDSILLTGQLVEELGFYLLPLITEKVLTIVPEYCRDLSFVTIKENKDMAVMSAGLVIKEMFAIPDMGNLSGV